MKTAQPRAPTLTLSDIGAMMEQIRRIIGDMPVTHVECYTGAFTGWLFTPCEYGDATPLARSMDPLDLVHEVIKRARESRGVLPGVYASKEPIELNGREIGGKPAVEVWLWTPKKYTGRARV
ncbi:hypothetical protein FJY94_03085 [Candidatus Kaiserbacteria bacterium]|nr:hypothetical protein [Candidatus Kaiserbacteria bacterium]